MMENGSIPTVPRYYYRLPLEDNFDIDGTHAWVVANFHLPVVSSLIYVLFVFISQHLMKNKKPVQLKPVLFLWNASLAIFSTCTAIRLLPEFFHGYRNFGFKHTMCSFCFLDDSPVTAFWSYVFTLSKLAELLDTFFLVVRKKEVSFLHWLHHCSVLIFTWFLLKEKVAMGRWFMNMNAVVHAVMYTYYAVASLNVKMPKKIALAITIVQVLQMIVGSFISFQGFLMWMNNEKCAICETAAVSGIAIYSVYLVLFLNFFVNAYILSRNKIAKKNR